MPETPDLLLLPGLLCDAALWQAQVAGLAGAARCLVADVTLDDTLPAMAARTLAAAPPRFALAGLSMGGYLAFEMLRQAPDAGHPAGAARYLAPGPIRRTRRAGAAG